MAQSVVVFDFDHTLTDWDCSARFFRWLIARERWRQALAVLSLAGLTPLWLHRRTRRYPVRVAVWIATLARSQDEIAALATEHVASLHAAGIRFVREDAHAELRGHLQRRRPVAIATGALEVLVESILAAERVDGVMVVGSTLRRWLGGMVADRYCFGHHKPVMLAERGVHAPYACVYTDHSDDLPLLERTDERFAINPRPACWARMQQRFGGGVQSLRWR